MPYCMNQRFVVEYLAAREPDISPRSCWQNKFVKSCLSYWRTEVFLFTSLQPSLSQHLLAHCCSNCIRKLTRPAVYQWNSVKPTWERRIAFPVCSLAQWAKWEVNHKTIVPSAKNSTGKVFKSYFFHLFIIITIQHQQKSKASV